MAEDLDQVERALVDEDDPYVAWKLIERAARKRRRLVWWQRHGRTVVALGGFVGAVALAVVMSRLGVR